MRISKHQDFGVVYPVGREKAYAKRKMKKYWTAKVTRESNALDLEEKVFTLQNPKDIAASLQRSADSSLRRKTGAFQSAMSMLNFYINRAGRNLPEERKKVLEASKEELRALYGRKRLPSRIKRRSSF